MIELVIHRPERSVAKVSLGTGAYLIGSGEGCHICLQDVEISRRHIQLVISEQRIVIMDLGSSNGTRVNDGEPLMANIPYDIAVGDTITLGKTVLKLQVVSIPPPEKEQKTDSNSLSEDLSNFNEEDAPILQISGVSPKMRPVLQEIKRQAHRELLTRLNLKKLAISGINADELTRQAAAMIHEILSQLTIHLPDEVNKKILERELIQEAIGLGPLEYMLERDDITEIMVNGPNQVFVEKSGKLYRTDTCFADADQVLAAIERIVAPLGRRIDESSPMVDARLPDGSRVNAVIPPLSLVGPTITIRKFSKKPLKATNLIEFGSISLDMMKFLAVCVAVRKNILISGGTGSGKTTLLNVLSGFLPNRERIVTIEDAAELQLHQEHLVRLESRPPNIEGAGAITIRDLVRNSLRMRPDRIVVGECRGSEALDMLQAMNTGHDGSLTTIHANSPRDALARLETLVLMSGFDLPLRAIREQIASAINIVVQISRERDGTRKVVNISEITKMEGDVITMQDIFVFRQTGWDASNHVQGVFEPTGSIPSFMEDIYRANLDLDIGIFSNR